MKHLIVLSIISYDRIDSSSSSTMDWDSYLTVLLYFSELVFWCCMLLVLIFSLLMLMLNRDWLTPFENFSLFLFVFEEFRYEDYDIDSWIERGTKGLYCLQESNSLTVFYLCDMLLFYWPITEWVSLLFSIFRVYTFSSRVAFYFNRLLTICSYFLVSSFSLILDSVSYFKSAALEFAKGNKCIF